MLNSNDLIVPCTWNHGCAGLRISDHRHPPTSLPPHLVDVIAIADGSQNFGDSSGKNIPLLLCHFVLVSKQLYGD